MTDAALDLDDFDDLGDDELLARLVARGVSPYVAQTLVDDRDTEGAAHRIKETLG